MPGQFLALVFKQESSSIKLKQKILIKQAQAKIFLFKQNLAKQKDSVILFKQNI